MELQQFIVTPDIYFKQGSMEYLKEIKGSQAMIISDFVLENLGYLEMADQYLNEAGIKTVKFTDVRPDPDVSVVANGLKLYQQYQPDILVALGGGSVIDTAKAILYAAKEYLQAAGIEYKKPYFIAIPSTSGTGSEVTDFSVITVKDEKVCIIDKQIAPDLAILDITCIQHVPAKVAVDTGMDVLVHALEAYLSVKATDFTDALAEKAIQLVCENLETLSHDPADSWARERLQNASCMAGIAFTNTGLGITHSLAHAFGGKFHISHGRANAVFLTDVLEYNANVAGKMDERVSSRMAHLSGLLNLPARTVREGTFSLIEYLAKIKAAVGIEKSIKALGIRRDLYENAVSKMAESAMNDRCTKTNSRTPSVEELVQIYLKAYNRD